MNAFTIGLLTGLAGVLLVAAIAKWRMSNKPMSVAEKAEYLSKRRARMLPALAIIFLSQQATFFGLATKGFWLEPKDVRDLIDDENTRANRNEAMRWGFLFAMGSAIAVYVLTMIEVVTGREAVHIVMSFGIAAALLRWGILERRAHRDA